MRVTVERAGNEPYRTDFICCKQCGTMFFWPLREGILPVSPERAEFIRGQGFGGRIDPRGVRPALKPKDPRYVDIDDPLDVRYWTAALLCSSKQLRAAVEAAGRGIVEVRRWLAG